MSASTVNDFLQHGNVRLSVAGAAEMDRNRTIVFIRRNEIYRVELSYGSAAERPVITFALAVILVGLSISPLILLAQAIRHGGAVQITFLTSVAFAIPAIWLLHLVF